MNRARGMKNPVGVQTKAKQEKPISARNERRLAKKQSIPKVYRRIKPTKSKLTYVLDTNVIMNAWDSIFKFSEHDVCIVGQVLAELDNHKKGHSSEAWNVRQAIRSIDNLIAGKNPKEIAEGIVLTPPSELVNGRPHTGKLLLNFSEPKIPEGMSTCLDVNHPDDRIILICLALQKSGKKVVLVSNDGSCRVKATVAGIDAEEYLSDTASDVQGDEDLSPGFHEMGDDFWESALVDHTTDKEGVSSYTLQHKSLEHTHRNEFIAIPNSEPLRIIDKPESDTVVARTFEYRSEIKDMGFGQRNPEQGFAVQLLLTTSIAAVSIAGLAGSGKTYLTLLVGIHLMKCGVYDRIIFTRSMQGADEEIGFLPGTEAEKMGPWMGALWDNVSTILKIDAEKPLEDQSDHNKRILSKIKVVSLNFMKGRSINKTLIIMDESQDLAAKALKMISTRVGAGSKIVFLGNVAQIDNPNLTSYTCGLSVFIRKFADSNLAGHVTLQKGERSPFATLAEERL